MAERYSNTCDAETPKEATHTSPQARGPAKVHGPMAVEKTLVYTDLLSWASPTLAGSSITPPVLAATSAAGVQAILSHQLSQT